MHPLSTGARIREQRLARGQRQAHLAAAVGISPSYLNLIEHDRRPIGGRLLVKLAEELGVERTALSAEEEDAALIEALRAAGADQRLDPEVLASAAEVARRFPDWARLISVQADTLATQARTIEALSDRLTHDPALAEAMHELLSTVSVVRSTASILAQTPEIDPNWLGRFHANLDSDSRRLAEGAEAVVSYLDRAAASGTARLTPTEAVAQFFDAHGHRFAEVEEAGEAAVSEALAEISDSDARSLAEALLRADLEDARRLPADVIAAAPDRSPDALLSAAGGDAALVLRRLGVTDPTRGLVVVDAAGALIRRKPVPGFALPVVGAGCPLWPVYEALSQPGRPLVRPLEMPDGGRWMAHAVAAPVGQGGFEAAAPLRATMLLTREEGISGANPVGPGCRVCPRTACAARREPSVLSRAAAAEAGHDVPNGRE